MIDFTNLPVRNKTYAGANGSKISVLYNNELYMLKFPAAPSINKNMSYANGCISEYLGSHIFAIVGIPVQETLLGTYTKNGKEKIVVACKDFTSGGLVLQDFASLKNTIIDSVHNGYGTELSDIIKTLEEQRAMDPQQLKDRFWDMFIVDIHPHLGPLCHHAEILRRRHHLRRRQGLTGKTILIRKVCSRGFPAVMLKCTKPAKLRGM